jgi:hypothetical protein
MAMRLPTFSRASRRRSSREQITSLDSSRHRHHLLPPAHYHFGHGHSVKARCTPHLFLFLLDTSHYSHFSRCITFGSSISAASRQSRDLPGHRSRIPSHLLRHITFLSLASPQHHFIYRLPGVHVFLESHKLRPPHELRHRPSIALWRFGPVFSPIDHCQSRYPRPRFGARIQFRLLGIALSGRDISRQRRRRHGILGVWEVASWIMGGSHSWLVSLISSVTCRVYPMAQLAGIKCLIFSPSRIHLCLGMTPR